MSGMESRPVQWMETSKLKGVLAGVSLTTHRTGVAPITTSVYRLGSQICLFSHVSSRKNGVASSENQYCHHSPNLGKGCWACHSGWDGSEKPVRPPMVNLGKSLNIPMGIANSNQGSCCCSHSTASLSFPCPLWDEL